MENMTEFEYAWMIYLVGAVGCTLATWLLFRRAGRAWVHFFIITVMVILFTPFSLKLDDQPTLMAPAIFCIAFGAIEQGMDQIKEIIKLLLGLWGLLQVLSLVYQLLTRHSYQEKLEAKRQLQAARPEYTPPPAKPDEPSRAEREAQEELLNSQPIRALR